MTLQTPCSSLITLSIYQRHSVEQASNFRRFATEIRMLLNLSFKK